ncbi:DbpA RNA binding domain-containing protein, partial [Komagataeibacter rhaeticus]|uniref:DbpA RNA binding domain-containing protein n=1 Tax=Komagataeibacter rhaeticus TaxID=215221 RepID=UPI0039E8ECA4
PRPPRESYGSGEPGAWFAMNVGRQEKADPKWLIPLICRLGGVRKADIGAIRINDTQTLFEITPESTEKFRSCIAAIENDEVQISPASAPAGGPPRRSGPPPGGGPGRPPPPPGPGAAPGGGGGARPG